jgi:rubrerythrin
MIPIEALKLALGEEIKAIALYQQLGVEHPSLQEVFSFLIDEEQKHKKMLENKITELTKY